MGIVDNLCSPGWEKDLTISVVSLDRKYEFKASIPPRSLSVSFWLRRRFGYDEFVVTKTGGAEGDIDVSCRIVRNPLVQVCISSTPGLEGRRGPIKDILGEKVVAMINEVEVDEGAGDVSDMLKSLAEKEILEFVSADGVSSVR
jgi:hypothetical protein